MVPTIHTKFTKKQEIMPTVKSSEQTIKEKNIEQWHYLRHPKGEKHNESIPEGVQDVLE